MGMNPPLALSVPSGLQTTRRPHLTEPADHSQLVLITLVLITLGSWEAHCALPGLSEPSI